MHTKRNTSCGVDPHNVCTCTPPGVLIEVSNERFPRRDLPTEEEKHKQRKYYKENQGIGFLVNIQRGITLKILNEIIRFKGLFVH